MEVSINWKFRHDMTLPVEYSWKLILAKRNSGDRVGGEESSEPFVWNTAVAG